MSYVTFYELGLGGHIFFYDFYLFIYLFIYCLLFTFVLPYIYLFIYLFIYLLLFTFVLPWTACACLNVFSEDLKKKKNI